MKNVEKHLVGWLSVCLLLCSFPVWAQGDAGDYLTIVGMVKDKQNKKALENVNVSVHGSNIGTVTNAEGEFALKIKKTETPRELDISHIGYVNTHISLEKETAAMLTVWLTPHSNLLNELVIYGAFEDKNLVGIMGTKNEGKHLSLFFIRKKYQCKGIGRQLFCFAINDCPVDEMTVNSSTYAIPFYQSLGFEKTKEKLCTNGITYTPMIFKRTVRISSIAPCGMDCALCYAFQDIKKPCPGCRTQTGKIRKSCQNCIIFSCDKKKYYCFECTNFPCKRLKALDARYQNKYKMSMIMNLTFIKEQGEENFLIWQNHKYTCPKCGKLRTVHYDYCIHCKQQKLT
jgi:predicted GNAT family N-acyltransferase